MTAVEFLGAGLCSAAYAFAYRGEEYVLRIGKELEPFAKDATVARLLDDTTPASLMVGIRSGPNIVACVSERVPGVPEADLSTTERRKIAPHLVETLIAIHHTDISGTHGYGWWTPPSMNGPFRSNRERVSAWRDELGRTATVLEDDAIAATVRHIDRLVPFLSEERHLLHGDYGRGNALADGSTVVGTIDWGNSTYGDRLCDVAWLAFHNESIDYASMYRTAQLQRGTTFDHFDERLLLYKLLIGAGQLEFATQRGASDERDMLTHAVRRALASAATIRAPVLSN